MARRKSSAKQERERKVQRKRVEWFEDTVLPKVEALVAPPVVPVEDPVERAAPKTVKCFRCSVAGQGMLCRRCSVALHGRPEEVNLWTRPVTPTTGY